MKRVFISIVFLFSYSLNAQNLHFEECSVSPMYPSYDIGPKYTSQDLLMYFKENVPEDYFENTRSAVTVQILIDKLGKPCCKSILNVDGFDGSIIKNAVDGMKNWLPATIKGEEINVSIIIELHPENGKLRKVELLDAKNEITLETTSKALLSSDDVEEALENISSLTSLTLYGKGLESVDPRIGQLSNLTELILGKNAFEEVPIEIFQLSSLEQLHLYDTKIKSIPKEISQLKNLKFLFLNDNQIEEIPNELGELQNLLFLKIDGNPLRAGELEKLRKMLPRCQIM